LAHVFQQQVNARSLPVLNLQSGIATETFDIHQRAEQMFLRNDVTPGNYLLGLIAFAGVGPLFGGPNAVGLGLLRLLVGFMSAVAFAFVSVFFGIQAFLF
jgi:hypothetical protein